MKDKIENIEIYNKEKKAEELDQCISAPHPEMARNTDKDEPCDDGRA